MYNFKLHGDKLLLTPMATCTFSN